MYLFNKRFFDFSKEREEVFLKLIKNDYSKTAVLEYRAFKEREVNTLKFVKTNLGKEIRGLLASISLCLIKYNFFVVSSVKGWGYYSCFLDYLEFYLCDTIFKAALQAKNNKVNVVAKIKRNKLIIKIKYVGKPLENIGGGYIIKAKGSNITLTATENLKKENYGESTEVLDFLINKLSPVNLAVNFYW